MGFFVNCAKIGILHLGGILEAMQFVVHLLVGLLRSVFRMKLLRSFC